MNHSADAGKQGVTALNGNNTVKRRMPHNLFFIELLVVLLFFAVSGGVVMNLFASADVRARRNKLTEQTMLRVQSVSELYAVCGDMDKTVDRIFGMAACVPFTQTQTVEETGEQKSSRGYTITFNDDMYPLVTPDGIRDYGAVELLLLETEEDMNGGTFHKLEIEAVTLFSNDGAELFYEGVSTAYIPDYEAAAAAEESEVYENAQ